MFNQYGWRGMHLKNTLSAFVLIGLMITGGLSCGAEELAEVELTPRMFPTRICPTTYISIELDEELELGLATWAKDGTFLYLADPNTFTTIPYYWQNQATEIRADALFGATYSRESGAPYLKPVFTEPGDYEFIFSDNLHTEPENSITVAQVVTYLGKDHPDCPKFPLQ